MQPGQPAASRKIAGAAPVADKPAPEKPATFNTRAADARIAMMFEREAMERAQELARGRRILITIAGALIAAIVVPILWSALVSKPKHGTPAAPQFKSAPTSRTG